MSTRAKLDCEIHMNELATDYCNTHNTLLCKACKVGHGDCADVRDIEVAYRGLIASGKVAKLLQDLEKVNREMKFFNELRNKDLHKLTSDKDKALKQMRNLRQKIKEVFDRLEKNMEQEINQTFLKQSNPIENQRFKLQNKIETVEEDMSKLKEELSSGNERCLFLSMQRIHLHQIQQFYQDLQKSRTLAEIRLDVNHKILASLKKIRYIGKLTASVKADYPNQDAECSTSEQTDMRPSDAVHSGTRSKDQQLDLRDFTGMLMDAQQPDAENAITVETDAPVSIPGLLATVQLIREETDQEGSTRMQTDTNQADTVSSDIIQTEAPVPNTGHFDCIHPGDQQFYPGVSTQLQNIQEPNIFMQPITQQSATDYLINIQTQDPVPDPIYQQQDVFQSTRIQLATQPPNVSKVDLVSSQTGARISDSGHDLVSIQTGHQQLDTRCPTGTRTGTDQLETEYSTTLQTEARASNPGLPAAVQSRNHQPDPARMEIDNPQLNTECSALIQTDDLMSDSGYFDSTQSRDQQSKKRRIQPSAQQPGTSYSNGIQTEEPALNLERIISELMNDSPPRPGYIADVQPSLLQHHLMSPSDVQFDTQWTAVENTTNLPTTPPQALPLNQLTANLKHEELTKVDEYNIQEADDSLCWISGAVFLADDTLLICDIENSKVKHLDFDMKMLSSIKLPTYPHDITIVSPREAVISIPLSEKLRYLNVDSKDTLKVGESLSLPKKCFGITFHKNSLYVTCRESDDNGKVLVVDLEGHEERSYDGYEKVTRMLKAVTSVAVGDDGIVYVSSEDTDTVTSLNPEPRKGPPIYRYTNGNLESPCKLLVDNEGYVFVCASKSHNIQIITPEGELFKELKMLEGFTGPYSMAYRASDKSLVVGGFENKIIVYRFVSESKIGV